jgi:hypothetical protein
MKRLDLIHPLLFAIFPILFIYAHNVQEASISQVFMPTVLALLFTLLLWIIISFLVKDKLRAGIITTVFLLMFFSYGHVFDLLEKYNLVIAKHRYTIPGSFFLFGYISYALCVVRLKLDGIARTLTFVASVLIIINLINIVPQEIRKYNVIIQDEQEKNASYKPDIYYIIVDEYASISTIKNIYNYDNGSFVDYLTDLGFYISRESRTPYPLTYKSLASSLNMEFIDSDDEISTYRKISNNKVVRFLKSRGYQFVYVGNWYDRSRYKMNADYQYNYFLNRNINYTDEFQLVLMDSTMLRPLQWLFDFSYQGSNNYRNSVIYSFNELKQIPNLESPKFVFAHILCPHTPFVFDQDGGEVDSTNSHNWRNKQYYLNQYIYVTEQLKILAGQILQNSKESPIIIIQSDHGPRPTNSPKPEQNFEIPKDEIHKIFNAYYLPNMDKNLLPENISPVNSFRMIFNYYFEENFELLEAN